MPLPLTADSLDAIPEPLRGAYVEHEGKYRLDAEVEDASPLREKNKQLLDETKAERRKRQELEQRLAGIEAAREAEAAGLSGEKLAEIIRKAEEKYAPKLAELSEAQATIRAMRLDGTVKSLLAKANAVDVEDAWKVVGSDFDLTDDGRVFLKSDPTADVEAYITKELLTKKGHLFRGTQAAGGGAAGQQRGGNAAQSKSPTSWTSAEISEYITAHGAEAYRSLLNESLRAGVKAA